VHVVRFSRKLGNIQCFCVHRLYTHSTSVGYNSFTVPIRVPRIAYVVDGDVVSDYLGDILL